MIPRHDPGFIGCARRKWSQRHIVTTRFDHARRLPLLLIQDVAEYTSFLGLKVLTSRAQFIEHTPRNEHCGGDLRGWVREFLSGARSVVLKQTDVFDPRVAL